MRKISAGSQLEREFIVNQLRGRPEFDSMEQPFSSGEAFRMKHRCARMVFGRAGPRDGSFIQSFIIQAGITRGNRGNFIEYLSRRIHSSWEARIAWIDRILSANRAAPVQAVLRPCAP